MALLRKSSKAPRWAAPSFSRDLRMWAAEQVILMSRSSQKTPETLLVFTESKVTVRERGVETWRVCRETRQRRRTAAGEEPEPSIRDNLEQEG